MQVGAQEGRARETCCEHHSHPEPRTAHFPESVPLTHLGPQVDHTLSLTCLQTLDQAPTVY